VEWLTTCNLAGEEADAREGGQGDDRAGAGALEATDPHAAHCVFQVLHDALREVVSGFFDAADSVPEHDLSELLAAEGTPSDEQACPPASIEHADTRRACDGKEPQWHSSRGSHVDENVAAASVPENEDLSGSEILEKLPRHPQAAAFVEYVLERMIFGLMQEHLARADMLSDGG